jgi:hypothetical protein
MSMSLIVPRGRFVRAVGFGAILVVSACGASSKVDRESGTYDPPDAGIDEPGDAGQPLDAGTSAPDAATDAPRTAIPENWDPELDCLAREVSVGANHACAITRGGHLFCWGANGAYQLGASSGTERCHNTRCARVPVPVAALASVIGVSMGTAHTCALTAGAVFCWGSNEGGTLGTGAAGVCEDPWGSGGASPCSGTPLPVSGVVGAVDIDAWGSTCVAERGGTVKCWGWEGLRTPTAVLGLENARSVEDGCALTGDGEALCWGSDNTAVPISWDGTGTQITKGYNQVCIVDDEARLHCWGRDLPWSGGGRTCLGCEPALVPDLPAVAQASGSLEVTWIRGLSGNVRLLTQDVIGEPLALPAPAVDLSAGYNAACAVLDDGRIYCWPNPGLEELTATYGLTSGALSEVRLCAQ